MTEPQFDPMPSETPAEEPTPTSPNRRGRPRSQDTLARDERVKEVLGEGAMTREQLAERLGDKPSLVYLALWRLNRQGAVEKTSDGSRHSWQLTS